MKKVLYFIFLCSFAPHARADWFSDQARKARRGLQKAGRAIESGTKQAASEIAASAQKVGKKIDSAAHSVVDPVIDRFSGSSSVRPRYTPPAPRAVDTMDTSLCNGKANLCDRPFNQIMQINSHNATSVTRPGLVLRIMPCIEDNLPALCDFDTNINPVADQGWNLQEQLDSGIRAFKLPIHPIGRENTPWVTHSPQESDIDEIITKITDHIPFGRDIVHRALSSKFKNNLWKIDTSNIKFLDVLDQIKTFLDTHPRDVITLELNLFELEKLTENLLNDFRISGINKYLYKPDPNDPAWPTLGQMIANNTRLVILADEKMDEPGFLHTHTYATSNRYGYKSLGELLSDDCMRIQRDPNRLFMMTHNLTGKVSGSPKLAREANSYEALTGHIQRCFEATGRYPNLISLDYIEQSFDTINRVIDEINSRDWPAPIPVNE